MNSLNIFLILPTQLFKDIKILKNYDIIYLVEEDYYFNPKFHKLKLVLHRSSLKYYYDYLKKNNVQVEYIIYGHINYDKLLKKNNIRQKKRGDSKYPPHSSLDSSC